VNLQAILDGTDKYLSRETEGVKHLNNALLSRPKLGNRTVYIYQSMSTRSNNTCLELLQLRALRMIVTKEIDVDPQPIAVLVRSCRP